MYLPALSVILNFIVIYHLLKFNDVLKYIGISSPFTPHVLASGKTYTCVLTVDYLFISVAVLKEQR